ncbi:myocardin-like, partial [Cetorhinus maximus]
LKSPSHFYGQPRGLDEVKTEDFTKHKMQTRPQRSRVVEMDILQDGASSPSRTGLKRPRLADDLGEKILHRPGPLELMEKNILPLDSGLQRACDVGCVRLPEGSEPLASEDEGSSSHSASPEVTGSRQAQAEPPLGPLQIPAPFPIAVANPNVPDPGDPAVPITSMAPPVMRVNKTLRQKRPKDTKPKVRKLKYHQYIPPDQKPDRSPVPMDAAYSRLLQQQQIFLQLQILNQQQQQTFSFQPIQPGTPGVPPEQIIGFASTVPAQVPCIPLSPLGRSCQRVPSAVCVKPELLPANLDDLTVSELRQQLRKRGLPVSGTKPALLERLRPYRAPGQRLAPPHPVERPSPGPEDASLAEKERVIERLTRRLQQEQHQAEGLWEELELRKRQQQQMPPAPLAGEFGAAPSPPTAPPRSNADTGPAEGSPPAAVSLQHRSEERGFSGLLVPRPVELEFPYSPSSLHSFFTLEDTEVEARNHSSSDENFDSEVFLCDSLGSEDRQFGSLETFSSTDSRGFQSLEDELTEAIKTAE